MVEVHVGEDDVFYILALVAEFGELINHRFLRVKGHEGNDAKELREPGGVGIILQPKTRIHEGDSVIRFDQQTGQSRFPSAWDACTAGKAIQDANGHDWNIAYKKQIALQA